ncbi:MAG: hypothetical protein A2138_05150 [Deltaproteobacteria bacterium RBG_16_71_12]|nr:MAG: hypothetical protein A2138_05150 [Deltaproteobacteria bacterium RBG_16_71_12]
MSSQKYKPVAFAKKLQPELHVYQRELPVPGTVTESLKTMPEVSVPCAQLMPCAAQSAAVDELVMVLVACNVPHVSV